MTARVTRPAVTVVMPFHGDPGEARSAANAMSRIAVQAGDAFVFVDNTAEGVARDLEADSVMVVRAPEQQSSYFARNVGAERARTEWLLFIDSDCLPRPDILDAYLADPPADRCALLAGRVVSAQRQDALIARYARSRDHINEQFHLETGPHPAGITANLMVRRAAWASIGGFHEGVRSGADLDFCWRIQDLDWSLSRRSGAVVEHLHPERLRPMLRKTRRHAAGRLWLNRLHRGVFPRPRLGRRLVRCAGGAAWWAARGQWERALFKLVDAAWSCSDAFGYLLGDNRARVAGSAKRDDRSGDVLVMTGAFPQRSETFVVNDVNGLGREGLGARVESSTRPVRPDRTALRVSRVSYMSDDPPRDKARDLLWLWGHHPLGCLRDRLARRAWLAQEPVWPLAALAPAARRLANAGELHVHVHFAGDAALTALRMKSVLGVPYSLNAHAYDVYQHPQNLEAKTCGASFTVTPSDYTAGHLRELVGPTCGPIERLLPGIDPSAFKRTAPHPYGRLVLGVGRLVEKKGFETLIEAAALIHERERGDDGEPTAVRIVGDGPLRATLAGRIERLGLAGAVGMVDAWGAEAVRAQLEQAAIFALPCVVADDGDRDSLPVAVLEAMAMELPVVGTAEVGLPEVVHPAWGRLVEPRDPEALAAAILELLALPRPRRVEMGRLAREFVCEHATLAGKVSRLRELVDASSQSIGHR